MASKAQMFVPKGMKRDFSASKADPQFAFANHNIRVTAINGSTLLSITNEKGNKKIKLDPKSFNIAHLTEAHTTNTLITCTFDRAITSFCILELTFDDNSTLDFEVSSSSESITITKIVHIVQAKFKYEDQRINTSGILALDTENLDNLLPFQGTILGHCVLNEYLVLFFKFNSHIPGMGNNYIVRLIANNNKWLIKVIFRGCLNLQETHPIETLPIYENRDIQKVYWVDGINQPRVINIMQTPEQLQTQNFNFVSEISAADVTINKIVTSNGIFPSGVVQYLITYIKYYGNESHPVYISDLLYLSPAERGGSPEEKVNNAFNIKIKPTNIDNYDAFRVYSLIRTSINSTPTAKLITTINFSKDQTEYNVIDTNTMGSNVDPVELLYKGGEPIIPYTFAHKDGTLFLGNYSLINRSISKELKTIIKDTAAIIFEHKKSEAIPTEGVYPYKSNLDKASSKISTFHSRECYRFGIQLLNKLGIWSEVIFIGDKRNILSIEQQETFTNLIAAKIKLSPYNCKYIPEEYIGIRGVVVYPDIQNREVICQGILCPTVFSAENRASNAPYVQSSWFGRPNLPYRAPDDPRTTGLSVDSNIIDIGKYWNTIYPADKYPTVDSLNYTHLGRVIVDNLILGTRTLLKQNAGNWPEFRHNFPIPDTSKSNAEIQNSYKPNIRTSVYTSEAIAPGDSSFFIDQNIVTLHSPDIEFNTDIDTNILNGCKLRIIGYASLTGNQSEMNVDGSAPGTFSRYLFNVASTNKYGGFSLMASPNWKAPRYKATDNQFYNWTIYPWHRSGALNNSPIPVGNEAKEATLKTKIISNLQFSNRTTYLLSAWNAEETDIPDRADEHTGISGAAIYLNNEQPLIKLPKQKYNYNDNDIIYYGEVNEILYGLKNPITTKYANGQWEYFNNVSKYPIRYQNVTPLENNIDYIIDNPIARTDDNDKIELNGSEPVILKYKSSPHAVISLNYTTNREQAILPTIFENLEAPLPNSTDTSIPVNHVNKQWDELTTLPFWLKDDNYKSYPIIDFVEWEPTPPYLNPGSELQEPYLWQKSNNTMWKKFAMGYYGTFGLAAKTLYHNKDNNKYYVRQRYDLYNYTLNEITLNGGKTFGVWQDVLNITTDFSFYWVGELYRDMPIQDRFNGTSEEALSQNKWLPAGPTTLLPHYDWGNINSFFNVYNQDVAFSNIGDTTLKNKTIFIDNTNSPVSGTAYHGKFINTGNNSAVEDWTVRSTAIDILWISTETHTLYKTDYDYTLDTNILIEQSVDITCNEGDTYYQRYDHLKTYAYAPGDPNSVVDIISFMCETRVNIDGRYDKNRGLQNNLAVSPNNFNLLNPVYSQTDSFFPNYFLPSEKFDLFNFPNSITWTKTKLNGEDIDPWTEVILASTLDLDGDKGFIEALRKFNNELYCFQPLGISRIFYNSHAQMLTQGEGSGNIPVELMNSGKVEGKAYITTQVGVSNKWSMVTTPSGLYFIDNLTNSLQLLSQDGVSDLSDKLSFRTWVSDVDTLEKWDPVNFKNVVSFYDSTNGDVYFITNNSNNTLCYSELIGQFISFFDYDNVPAMFPMNGQLYSFKNGYLWQHYVGDYNSFYGSIKPYSVEIICNADEPIDKIFNTIEWRATIKENSLDSTSTFDTIKVTTDGGYQDTGNVNIFNMVNNPRGGMIGTDASLRRKFRMWRIPIPRDNSIYGRGIDRMRGPWAKIKLSKEHPVTEQMELHDLVVRYFE